MSTQKYGDKMCARCGVIRKARHDAVLCRDCRYVLTQKEIELWNNPRVVEAA